MKLKNLLFAFICLLIANMSFTSCSDDDDNLLDDNGSKIELPQTRAYILNEGTNGASNANIIFYNPVAKSTIKNFFFTQNGAELGDTGQDMIEYNGSIYVSVYGSNYITRLNAAGVEQRRKSFVEDAILKGGIRYIAAEDGFIYASFYGGAVAKIDANTLEVVKTITNLGNNLEGVTIADDYLYVANSYKKNGTQTEYQKDLFIINLQDFTLKQTAEVTQNPNQLIEEDDKVFLISWDYSQESYVLQLVNPAKNNEVSNLGFATNMAAGDDIVYLVDSRTDYSNWPSTSTVSTFSSYNTKTGTLNKTSFLKDAPAELASSSIYMMKVNKNNGDIYIGVTFYAESNGTMYRFSKDGSFIEKFDCEGQNPKSAIFFN